MQKRKTTTKRGDSLVLLHVPSTQGDSFNLCVIPSTSVSIAVISRDESGGGSGRDGIATNTRLPGKKTTDKLKDIVNGGCGTPPQPKWSFPKVFCVPGLFQKGLNSFYS